MQKCGFDLFGDIVKISKQHAHLLGDDFFGLDDIIPDWVDMGGIAACTPEPRRFHGAFQVEEQSKAPKPSSMTEEKHTETKKALQAASPSPIDAHRPLKKKNGEMKQF